MSEIKSNNLNLIIASMPSLMDIASRQQKERRRLNKKLVPTG
jgi:hypothetical protein